MRCTGKQKVRDQDSRIHVSEVTIEDTTSPEILEIAYSVKSESIILVGCQAGHVQHSAISRALVEPDQGPNLGSQVHCIEGIQTQA